MQRRRLLLAAPLALAPAAPALAADAPTLDATLRWLDELEAAKAVRTLGSWPIGTVLQHLAQSIEMSLDGYPEPRSAVFQHTAGAAAFAFFRWRGRMSHNLAEPIPGAPKLETSTDVRAGAARLRAAIARFRQHTGRLKPHFAYGALDRADYERAHGMHWDEHRQEVLLDTMVRS